jgi:hypothetical protein
MPCECAGRASTRVAGLADPPSYGYVEGQNDMKRNPRWMLTCDKCNSEFAYSDVLDRRSQRDNPFTGNVHKPEFPSGGLSLECPNCKKSSVYQSHQLFYGD